MKKVILFIGFLITLSSFAQTKDSSTSYSFSITQAIDFAMKNQKDVKNAIIDESLALEKVHETRAIGLPQINSSFDVKDFIEIPTTLLPAEFVGGPPGSFIPVKFGTQYNGTASLEGSQLLFNAEYFLGLKASKVYRELSARATERTKIETAATVTKAYYTVLISQERMKLMDANIARVKKVMEDTKVLLNNGLVEKLDLDRLTVTYNNLLVEQEKIQRLLDLGTHLLKFQMGMNINTALTLTDKLEGVKLDIVNVASTDKFDYAKRVEYNLFETQYRMAKLDLKRQQRSYLPTALAYGSLSGNAYRNTFSIFSMGYGWYPTALIGGTIRMPIFTGLQRNAKNQQAKLSLLKAENNMDFIKKSIDLELASSVTTLQNASLSLDNQKKNIAIAEDVVRVTKLKYEQGVGSNMEMITAETALKEAQTNYFNALFDAIVAKTDFDKATGNFK
ncbi:MAG: TolC family protein [Bacteroidetes bacterium]|nr:TolC family protein [Bacteroidota bacterium]